MAAPRPRSHVVFGKVIEGMDIVKAVEAAGSQSGKTRAASALWHLAVDSRNVMTIAKAGVPGGSSKSIEELASKTTPTCLSSYLS